MNSLPIQLGLAVIVGTHVWMLNELMPPDVQKHHAYINLAAAAAIGYGVYY